MIFAVVLVGAAGVLKLIFWLPAFNEAFDESAAEPEAEVPYEVELVLVLWDWPWTAVWVLV